MKRAIWLGLILCSFAAQANAQTVADRAAAQAAEIQRNVQRSAETRAPAAPTGTRPSAPRFGVLSNVPKVLRANFNACTCPRIRITPALRLIERRLPVQSL